MSNAALDVARGWFEACLALERAQAEADPEGVAQAHRLLRALRAERTRFCVVAGKRTQMGRHGVAVRCVVPAYIPEEPRFEDAARLREQALRFAAHHWRNVYDTREAAEAEAERIAAVTHERVRVLAVPHDVVCYAMVLDGTAFPMHDESVCGDLPYIQPDDEAPGRAQVVDNACAYAHMLVEALDAFLKPARVERY